MVRIREWVVDRMSLSETQSAENKGDDDGLHGALRFGDVSVGFGWRDLFTFPDLLRVQETDCAYRPFKRCSSSQADEQYFLKERSEVRVATSFERDQRSLDIGRLRSAEANARATRHTFKFV